MTELFGFRFPEGNPIQPHKDGTPRVNLYARGLLAHSLICEQYDQIITYLSDNSAALRKEDLESLLTDVEHIMTEDGQQCLNDLACIPNNALTVEQMKLRRDTVDHLGVVNRELYTISLKIRTRLAELEGSDTSSN